jgi:hypothetical protein
MNGIIKRKKLLESLSTFGLNECCCECNPRQGRILATNLNTDGTLSLISYKKEGGILQKWAIRYFSWGGNVALRGDIVDGELIGLPDTFNFGTFTNQDHWKKIYFELIIGCSSANGSMTCVSSQFNIPNFYEVGVQNIDTFLNRDFSQYIGFSGYTVFGGDFDIGYDGSIVWYNKNSFDNISGDFYYYLENKGIDCGYSN